jgi:hypothetical protein
MADNVTSQVQQNISFWHGLVSEHLARVEAYGEEMKKAQEKGVREAKIAAEETTKLVHAWVDYGTQLSQDFQKLALEGAKRGLELLRPQV